jgi:hypothetical protein
VATFNKFNAFVEHVAEKVHNLASDTLKVYLTNNAPDAAADAVLADLAEISAGNGYTAGGNTAAQSSSAQTSGTYKLVLTDVVFTATGSLGPLRYAVLYNDTPTANSQGANADPLIAWWDYGSSITLATGESFTTDFDGTNGVLQIA